MFINMTVFVSFDFEHDRNYKYLLEAWNKSSSIDFTFEDNSSREINTYNIARVKAALTTKIRQSDCIVVIIGAHSDDLHNNSDLIGYRNWQYFEIAKAKEAGLKIVAIKLRAIYRTPSVLYNCGTSWAYSFSLDSITQALNR